MQPLAKRYKCRPERLDFSVPLVYNLGRLAKLDFDQDKGDVFVVFRGISKVFSLSNEQQYETIGQFWDELALIYGLENLQGLGYSWKDSQLQYIKRSNKEK